MKIEQIRVSKSVSYFAPFMQSKFGLHTYNNPTKPALFFGCYRRSDVRAILNHMVCPVILWGGTDAANLKNGKYKEIRRRKNIAHVAQSIFISEDLQKFGIPHVLLPVCAAPLEKFSPCELGNSVYFYYGTKKKWKFYGGNYVERLQDEMPDLKVIKRSSGGKNSVPANQMPGIYSKCFIGLRLVPHDGISWSVIEMGLMGRRVVHNGDAPNAIPWSNYQDVKRAVLQERKKIGSINIELAEQVKDYIDIGEDWLDTDYYFRRV